MTLINSQIIDVKANSRFATYISSDGTIFVMGRDFRPLLKLEDNVNEENGGSIYGIPKYLSLPEKIHSLALGTNHLTMMSASGKVFSMGSNQFG
jgi:alpha-tubulin suppressor-like RCC1 family protein